MSSCYDVREIVSSGGLEKLPSHEKFSMLKNHFKANKTYIFSNVHLHGCQSSCNFENLNSRFVYSKKEDALYCIHCALFHHLISEELWGLFVSTGHTGWNNIHEKQTFHIPNKHHDGVSSKAFVITVWATK